VQELATFLTGLPRNTESFRVCVERAKRMVSIMSVTPEEERRIVLYGPPLAFVKHFWEEQETSMVVAREYWFTGWWDTTVAMTKQSFKNLSLLAQSRPWTSSLVASGVVGLGALVRRLIKRIRGVSLLRAALYYGSLPQDPGYINYYPHAAIIDYTPWNVIYTLLIAPFGEEWVKRNLPWFPLAEVELLCYSAAAAGQAAMASSPLGWAWLGLSVANRLYVYYQHKKWEKMSYNEGVVSHARHNILALVTQPILTVLQAWINGHSPRDIKDVVFTTQGALVFFYGKCEKRLIEVDPSYYAQAAALPISAYLATFFSYSLSTFSSLRSIRGRIETIKGNFYPTINSFFQMKEPLKPKAQLLDMNWRSRYFPTDQRGFVHCWAFKTGEYSPTAFSNNKHNEKIAIEARVLGQTPKPQHFFVSDYRSFVLNNFRRLFPRMYNIPEWSFSDYIKSSNAQPSVKRLLTATNQILEDESIDCWSQLTPRELHDYTKRKAFIKVELDLYSSRAGFTEKAPRLIQGAQPQFTCLVGRWVSAVQAVLKRRWNVSFPILFSSGKTNLQLAKHIDKPNLVYVEDDFSKFDSTIHKYLLAVEVEIFKRFGCPKAVLALIRKNVNTRGVTLHGYKYKCEGTRKSGDPYTSLMNSITNALVHLYVYCRVHSITCEQALKEVRMLVQGDDNVFAYPSWRPPIDFAAEMLKLGLVAKPILHRDLNNVEFCSSRIVHTNQGPCFAPKPGRVLSKLGYFVSPPNVHPHQLLRGVALGLMPGCQLVPPIKAVLDRILLITTGSTPVFPRGLFEDYKMTFSRNLKPDYYPTMLNLAQQYNWTLAMQSSLEMWLSSAFLGDSYPVELVLPLFDSDTGGPKSF